MRPSRHLSHGFPCGSIIVRDWSVGVVSQDSALNEPGGSTPIHGGPPKKGATKENQLSSEGYNKVRSAPGVQDGGGECQLSWCKRTPGSGHRETPPQ